MFYPNLLSDTFRSKTFNLLFSYFKAYSSNFILFLLIPKLLFDNYRFKFCNLDSFYIANPINI